MSMVAVFSSSMTQDIYAFLDYAIVRGIGVHVYWDTDDFWIEERTNEE